MDPDDDAPSQPARALLRMQVDARTASLAFLALAAALAVMRWAQDFMVPVLLGAVLSAALWPLVAWLHARRVPYLAASGLVLSLLLAAVLLGGYLLRTQATALISSLPEVAQQVRRALAHRPDDDESALAKVQRAASELESAAKAGDPPASEAAGAARGARPARGAPPPPTRVVVEKGGINVRDYLLTGTVGLATFVAQAVVVVFVAFFLLGSGNSLRNKLVVLTATTAEQRRIAVQAMEEVQAQVQRYLLVQVATSVLVGVLTWLAFLAIGLNSAGVWGVAAAVANLVPYVGSVATSAGAALVGFVQFREFQTPMLLAGASFVVHLVVGNLIAPWLMGKLSRMSAVVVFVGVLFFGWLWGIAGLILAFPMLVTVKVVCDSVEGLRGFGRLLGQ